MTDLEWPGENRGGTSGRRSTFANAFRPTTTRHREPTNPASRGALRPATLRIRRPSRPPSGPSKSFENTRQLYARVSPNDEEIILKIFAECDISLITHTNQA